MPGRTAWPVFCRRVECGAETRVGLLIDRSIEMAVGVLGILKAGGAFVPLDPSEPGPRLAAMVKAAGLSIVLTRRTLRGHLTSFGCGPYLP